MSNNNNLNNDYIKKLIIRLDNCYTIGDLISDISSLKGLREKYNKLSEFIFKNTTADFTFLLTKNNYLNIVNGQNICLRFINGRTESLKDFIFRNITSNECFQNSVAEKLFTEQDNGTRVVSEYFSNINREEYKNINYEDWFPKDQGSIFLNEIEKKLLIQINPNSPINYILISLGQKIQKNDEIKYKINSDNFPTAILGLMGKDLHDSIDYCRDIARFIYPIIVNITQFQLWIDFITNILDKHDLYSYYHSLKVYEYAKIAAKKLNLSFEDMLEIDICAPLHDLGKLYVNRSILWNPYQQDKYEYEVIKKHPEEGAELLSILFPSFTSTEFIPVCFHHLSGHEKRYPSLERYHLVKSIDNEIKRIDLEVYKKLEELKQTEGSEDEVNKLKEINKQKKEKLNNKKNEIITNLKKKVFKSKARAIIQLADCFDAATSKRPYHKHGRPKNFEDFEKEIKIDKEKKCETNKNNGCKQCEDYSIRIEKNKCPKEFDHFVVDNFDKFKYEWQKLHDHFKKQEEIIWDTPNIISNFVR